MQAGPSGTVCEVGGLLRAIVESGMRQVNLCEWLGPQETKKRSRHCRSRDRTQWRLLGGDARDSRQSLALQKLKPSERRGPLTPIKLGER
jgi:hypothetical protein